MPALNDARKAARSRMLEHYAGKVDEETETAIAAAKAAAEAEEELELQYEVGNN